MGHVLAKLPQQRIRAGEKHPTLLKLEKLFDFMDELGLELDCYDGIFVYNIDRTQDKGWLIRDIVNNALITELPCNVDGYKLTQDVDVTPRNAQHAPKHPKKKKILQKKKIDNH